MRIRHYFGNNGQSIASDRQRQNEELADRNDNEFNTQKSPVPSTIDDSVKVIEWNNFYFEHLWIFQIPLFQNSIKSCILSFFEPVAEV